MIRPRRIGDPGSWVRSGLALCLIGLVLGKAGAASAAGRPGAGSHGAGGAMKIWSPDFEPGEAIPAVFTCDGEDRPPALSWSGVPAAAKSLALAVEDPDAPRGTWVHWIVVGLSPSSSGLASGRGLPAGAREIANDFGRPGYGGPCPPRGTHRYYFRLYALDVEDLPGATRANYSAQCRRHALAAAELMGRYARR